MMAYGDVIIMTTDKELLYLAAKAAGLNVLCFDNATQALKIKGRPSRWNPLTDDGDAQRLAVNLHLVVGCYETYASVGGTYAPNGYQVPNETLTWHHETRGDKNAACRLAITRAAAEIGKAMP